MLVAVVYVEHYLRWLIGIQIHIQSNLNWIQELGLLQLPDIIGFVIKSFTTLSVKLSKCPDDPNISYEIILSVEYKYDSKERHNKQDTTTGVGCTKL